MSGTQPATLFDPCSHQPLRDVILLVISPARIDAETSVPSQWVRCLGLGPEAIILTLQQNSGFFAYSITSSAMASSVGGTVSPGALAVLRLISSERPCRCCATSECNEISPPHSITLSARANNASGTVTPIALAVLRLITSSNLVGCSTGTSATLAPRNSLMIC